ncbi:uncharacterized protein LOC106152065 [Lingula anatina]|uniref:Uncharacterized protein LOC106152065 n=1 Tax=Lingula anatina TaxID=7574 RepID=A0A1S3H4R5_LINAN|nr:uncharacterized protein LOC106152065 [Lingula anatina]|eukprot:XP_013380998.1 uncharacterized protein LOC106152065 [Lingula anatina]
MKTLSDENLKDNMELSDEEEGDALERKDTPRPETPRDEEEAEQDKKKKKKKKKGKCGKFCRKFIKFMFSHVGLGVLVIAYSIGGGFIFEHLEVPNEEDECKKAATDYYKAENNTLSLIWDIASQAGDAQDQDIKDKFKKKLQEFGVAAVSYNYVPQTNCSLIGQPGGPKLIWNWANAFLFALTVVTTIGYGHIAPRTMWGKLVCIAYAVLGIPLTLLFLTNIGDVMADIFRYIYAKVCCCGCIRKKNKDKVQEIRTPSPTKGWKLDETGKPLPPSREPTIIDNDDDDDDEEEEKITVPLTVTMLVIIGWLLGGSVLYTVWYKDWKWYSSFYFCFITMSTIGFGDYYPSVDNGLGTVEDIMIMVSAWTYTIVGMAFLAMGFNLMQDEIVDKFKWIGEKLGFYKKEEEEGEEAEEYPTLPSPNFWRRKDDKKQKKGSAAARYCKLVVKYTFSHVGLIIMVILYSVAGGFLFQSLEEPNELDECKVSEASYQVIENATLNKMWEITNTITNDNKDQIVELFTELMRNYSVDTIDNGHEPTKVCNMLGKEDPVSGQVDYQYNWNWPNAFLFALTIVSTIGYGHISPNTMWGQLATIAYALLGIPLMLICLANIGDVMADIFRWIYSNVCCCGCCKKKQEKEPEDEKLAKNGAWRTDASGKPIPPGSADNEESDDEDEEDEDEKITVPLTITMIVIAVWIVFGAALFDAWEKDWSFLEASYFCFITLTTIGFGDYVPGVENLGTSEGQIQMIIAWLYIVFGMALVAMCFTLMQDEIVAKFAWIAEKIGLAGEDEDADGKKEN